MDYHDITMKGPFIGDRVSEMPTWTANDEGREIYDITNHKKYYGGSSGWVDYIDGKVLVSSTDSVREYLEDKITEGDDIEINNVSSVLNINNTYSSLENYLVGYNNIDQLITSHNVWTDLTFTNIAQSRILSFISDKYVDLTANVKYNIHYNVIYESVLQYPFGYARFHTVSGDTTWNLDNISETAQYRIEGQYLNLSYSTVIIPSSATRISVQAKTENGLNDRGYTQQSKVTYASLLVWT